MQPYQIHSNNDFLQALNSVKVEFDLFFELMMNEMINEEGRV